MEWVKKNLGFVAGLAVAVVLLGVGIWYSLGTMAESSAADGELQAKKQQLDDLVKRDPYPEQPNIDLARSEEERVNGFIREARKKFLERQLPEGLDNATFKSQLESTIAELSREAERAGVKLPEKYNFTFEEQRKQLQLPAASLVPLTAHLDNLASLCRVLFDAKAHSLVSLKRASAGTNEMVGTGDLLNKKVSTNSTLGTVTYPYEMVFQGHSQELANVMVGLINSPQAFVLKTLNVERGSLDSNPTSAAMPMTIPGLPPGMDPALARRYGMMNRYQQLQAPTAPTPTATAGRPGETVLEEKPLRITMGLEVVSLLPTKDEKKDKGRGPAPDDAAAQTQ